MFQELRFRHGACSYVLCGPALADPGRGQPLSPRSARAVLRSALRGPTGQSLKRALRAVARRSVTDELGLAWELERHLFGPGRLQLIRLEGHAASGAPPAPTSPTEPPPTDEGSAPALLPPEAPATVQSCERTGVEELANFMADEMRTNATGADAAFIRANIVTDGILSGLVKYTTKWGVAQVLAAYYHWYKLVKPGGIWDHKPTLEREFGTWSCDFDKATHYYYDIWSNIHYGYVGLAAGFPEKILLGGAGVAQAMAGTVPDGYWQRAYDRLFDLPVLEALDDPRDQSTIEIGFELWKSHGAELDAEALLEAVREHSGEFSTQACSAEAPAEAHGPVDPLPLEGSVGENGDNHGDDVVRVRERLVALGYDWLDVGSTCDDELIAAIRLFQSITAGRRTVAGDGLIEVNRRTHRWLRALNAPRWQLMTAAGEGFVNDERAEDDTDEFDHGTHWLDEVIIAAGADYERNYHSDHPDAAPLTLNDASPPQGHYAAQHEGHQTGLDVDLRLPRTDGNAGGIEVSSNIYDRDAMRAMLEAFAAQDLASEFYLNDAILIAEGLCQWEGGHDNHAHIGIDPPARAP